MLELYYLEEADSICSNRPRMTLSEKGIDDWIGHKLVLVNGDQFKPESLTVLTVVAGVMIMATVYLARLANS
jgi:hypothetical protein